MAERKLKYQLECLDQMIERMEANGVLSYYGMDLDDLKALSAFIHLEVDDDGV